MKSKLLIFTFILCLNNYLFSGQHQISDTMSKSEFDQNMHITLDLSKGLINPIENCANFFMGAYGSKNQNPQSKSLPKDAIEYMHASTNLKLLLTEYAQALEMEHMLQNVKESAEFSYNFRILFDESEKGNEKFIPLMTYNMTTCVNLMSFFITMHAIVLE
tara:strand:+ start:2008 stop:2490 length:483 start_codon:yes stop_codon:yes gene_type:complete